MLKLEINILNRSNEFKLAFFGDSICFGQGISIHKGWVPKISGLLERLGKSLECNISVTNVSINGNTTRQALERMPYDIQSHEFDAILIQFGMNDCNYWLSDKGLPRVSKSAFEANLHEIIDRALNFGAKIIFLNTNHPTTKNDIFPNTNISYQESNFAYNKIIRKVAQDRKEVTLNDIENHVFTKNSETKNTISKYLLSDKLHLSIEGHELYYQFIAPVIIKKLESILKNHLIA